MDFPFALRIDFGTSILALGVLPANLHEVTQQGR
jgi:hypothetical protein